MFLAYIDPGSGSILIQVILASCIRRHRRLLEPDQSALHRQKTVRQDAGRRFPEAGIAP